MISAEAIGSVYRYGKAFAGMVKLITRAGGLADYLTILIGKSSALRSILRFLGVELIAIRNFLWGVGDAIIMLVTKPMAALSAAWTFITEGIAAATTAAWEFAAALAVDPITWIVVAVVALVGWVIYLVRHWDDLQKSTQKWGDSLLIITSMFAPIVGIPLLLAKHWDTFKGIFINIWRTISNVVQVFWFKLKDWSSSAWQSIKQDFSALGDWFGAKFKPITDLFVKAWDGIKGAFEWIKNMLAGSWLGKVGGFFGKAFGGMADASAQALINQRKLHGLAYTDVKGGYQFDPNNPDTKPTSSKNFTSINDPNPLVPRKPGDMGVLAPPGGSSPASAGSDPFSVQPGGIVINMYGSKATPEEVAKEVDKILTRRKLSTKSRGGEH